MMTKIDPVWLQQRQVDGVTRFTLMIPEDLDYFNGHFNGAPVLPGVVQLQWAITQAQACYGMPERCARLEVVKFQQLQRPGQQLTLELERLDEGRVRFAFFCTEKRYSSGRIVFEPESV
ncbi:MULTISPECIES: hypothetical protein [Ferrimonas]|uniref:ApeI family dehydratase n=1 Tax=Ferrimonas TaxID=44011 RepID=UPI000486A25B|nr:MULTISPECIES: hypothetical protein [Ferrimonas]USD39002.1 thioester dehydrase [Ferrimonas sp. SCSIO 43195]